MFEGLVDDDPQWFYVLFDGTAATVFVRDDIGAHGKPARVLIDALSRATEIEIWFNSCGGCAKVANDVYHALRGRVKKAVVVRAFSAAGMMAMVADEIEISQSGAFMVHPPKQWQFGTAVELEIASKYLRSIQAEQEEVFIERTGQPREVVESWFAGPDDKLFSAEEAIKAGLAHRMIQLPAVECGDAATGAQTLSAERQFFSALNRIEGLQVRNRATFVENIARWAAVKVSESI